MNKSIETIWKEGFLNETATVAPRLNDLYGQKSQHIVDRLIRMSKLNLFIVAVAAVAVLGISHALDTLVSGALIATLLFVAVGYGLILLARLPEIDKSEDCYSYLKAFDAFLKQAIAGFTRLYRIVYPAFLLAAFQVGWSVSGAEAKWAEAYPTAQTINGIGMPFLIGALVMAALVSLLAGPLYRLDVKIVYGRAFDKLRELLVDMEELRS